MIVGDTDAGKSGIQRALRWLCYNEPSGDEFIRRDADSIMAEANGQNPKVVCTVSLKLSSGQTIIRSKGLGSNLNRYTLIDEHGEELEFNNFGYDVPDEIRAALGFHHLTLDKTKLEVNYIPQMESPLAWAYQGAGLSRLLNKFNNIDDFENLLKRINKRIHARGDIASEIKVLQSGIDEKSKELSILSDPSDVIEQAKELLSTAVDLEERENQLNSASSLVSKYDDINHRLQRTEHRISMLNRQLSLSDPVKNLGALSRKIQSAEKILKSAEDIRNRLASVESRLSKSARIASLNTSKMTELASRIQSGQTLLSKASVIGVRIQKNSDELDKINDDLIYLQEKRREILTSIVEDLKTCPTCEQQLEGDSAKKVIRRISNE